MKTPSICIMTSVHRHDDVRIYHKEAKSLRQMGCRVTILCPDYEGTDELGIQFRKVSVPKGRFARMLTASRRFAREATRIPADFYHFHDPELLGAGLRLSRKGRVIYDIHEDVPRQILTKPYLKPWAAKLASRWMERRERKAVRRLFGVVAAEPVIYERMKGFCRHLALVCNYPILSEFTEPQLDFSRREDKVCYLGGITEIRGAFEMLEAVREGCPAELLLAGEYETEELRRRMEAHPGFARASYLGFLTRPQVREMLSQVKAGLVTLHPTPKYQTALPVKMFEYMIAEVPVIASNFPYWSDIVNDAGCGICVDPMKPEEIRGAVDYICRHPDIAREMGRNGREKVLEKYNWDREKEKLFALYREGGAVFPAERKEEP